MSDIVTALRRAASFSRVEHFAEHDAVYRRLCRARDSASERARECPVGSGRRGGQLRAKLSIKCEAVDRRLRELQVALDLAKKAEWPR